MKARRWNLIDRMTLFISLIFFLAAFNVASADSATIDSVRIRQSPERTRIVFDLSSPIQHKIFALSNPRRLVIDIESAEFTASFKSLDLISTPIIKIRSAKRNSTDVRVVLDLRDKIKPRSFVLKPILQYGDRLVVDLYAVDQKIAPPRQDKIHRISDVVIAIDAGHGGDDPGAIGYGRLLEKDVVLAIADKLAAYFDREPGYRSRLIREGDYYVGLRKRTEIAHQNPPADVYLSIHADAFKTPEAKGASVYAISQSGATSEAARILAEKENRADLIGGVGGVSLNDKDDLLVSVILDLSMTHSLAASLEMGKSVLRSIKSVSALHKKKVEQADFAVLKSPDIPSLLIEIGYISNPFESRRLRTKKYQNDMARAIFKGIHSYIRANPPAGSYLAWKKRGGAEKLSTYKIESGDTLSAIAVKYQVSARSLMKVNGLSGESIRIGQVLRIPTTR